MKKRFVIRLGYDNGKCIEKWVTWWIDANWFKMATDYAISKTIREMYREAKK